jgi:hypothetical protein
MSFASRWGRVQTRGQAADRVRTVIPAAPGFYLRDPDRHRPAMRAIASARSHSESRDARWRSQGRGDAAGGEMRVGRYCREAVGDGLTTFQSQSGSERWRAGVSRWTRRDVDFVAAFSQEELSQASGPDDCLSGKAVVSVTETRQHGALCQPRNASICGMKDPSSWKRKAWPASG